MPRNVFFSYTSSYTCVIYVPINFHVPCFLSFLICHSCTLAHLQLARCVPGTIKNIVYRFHGNYNSVYGGQSGDAFLALTGGCSEYIDFDDALETDSRSSKMKQALMVHNRLKNACSQGECMLTTEVPVRLLFDLLFDNYLIN